MASPVLAALVVQVIATTTTVVQAKQEADAADAQVAQERLAAKDRATQRLQQLRRAQAENVAAQAGSGLSLGGGSLLALQQQLEEDVKADEFADNLNVNATTENIRQRARNARNAAIGSVVGRGAESLSLLPRSSSAPRAQGSRGSSIRGVESRFGRR